MKKIVLIDGNNLLFRSFFATAYSGGIMKNSKDFPTNALYGFTSMINKIIAEEKPQYIAVAFDVGINFRKKEYAFYKEGRSKTPEELKVQMPIARKILDAMQIKYFELEPYEADDIIGTFVKKIAEDNDFDATIISSDKDLLQLINFETDVKLLKQTGFIRYNEKTFYDDYQITPDKIIDLKALMGDSSDNIPGVKGIGEKTALKLLHDYGFLENIYENIESIKGSVHDKLVASKDDAFISKKLATIYKDVPLEVNLDDLKYEGPNNLLLKEIYMELEFSSLLKNINSDNQKKEEDLKYFKVNEDINVVLGKKVALYIECDNEVYTKGKFIGAALTDGKYTYFFGENNKYLLEKVLIDKDIITYDHKKNMYFLSSEITSCDDLMLSSYLLGYNIKDDIAYLSNIFNYEIDYLHGLLKEKNLETITKNIIKKVKFIWSVNDILLQKIKEESLEKLYREIEMPLIKVLSKMEKTGVIVSKEVLENQKNSISIKIENLTKKIYNYAGMTFNIASPRQLGEVLFDYMELGKGKKNKTGYKTDVATLEKIKDKHPIIEAILEYRNLTKIKSTYIEGLQASIFDDGKVHTIFKQALTRTGRLSSVEPNLQNIPIKEELGRKIREAFLPSNDLFLSLDYSQIELRLLAHISKCQAMIDTFKMDGDIHSKVASDINNVALEAVTKDMRAKAKSVIFGIVYGISGYGLGENLHINKKEADYFIEKYYSLYPEVKAYMNEKIDFALQYGFVTTLFNRKRVIDEIKSSNYMIREQGKRMAINTPIQGTAADIMKLAMIRVDKKITEANFKSKMVLQVHDELIFDVTIDEVDALSSLVKNEMENVLELLVPLKVSCDTGKNWYETK